MSEDEAFLRAILAQPDDMVARLAYADWLEDRADPRAEYLLLEAKLAKLSGADGSIRSRLDELRAALPSWWLAIVGGLNAMPTEPDPKRIDLVAQRLGRLVSYVDSEGYERTITAAAVSGLHDAVAYVECRSQQRGSFLDINFYLRIRGSDGREMMREVESYNPYFGCDVRFFEWFGDEALVIYEEKHDTYICRFGLDFPANFKVISSYWALNGCQLGYWHKRAPETNVRRVTIPGIEELTPLSESGAAKLGLLPTRKYW
jgi:uncharacterized protein (TIGR02996 family)